jgi:hypothetical protein
MTQFKETKTVGKTGYEVRTDVLSMAKDLAILEFTAKYELMEQVKGQKPTIPEFPSVEYIIGIANKMNEFVTTR